MNPTPKPLPNGAKRAAGKATFSPRRQQVVELVAQGLSNAEIAAQLGLKKATVRWALKAIHRRTGQPLRLVRTAVLAVGLATSGLAGAGALEDDKTGPAVQPAPLGGGLVTRLSGSAGQGTKGPGSATKTPMVQTPPSPLSPRQDQVLKLAAQGKLDKEIAAELGISEETVATHLKRLFRRMAVHSRAALVSKAQRR